MSGPAHLQRQLTAVRSSPQAPRNMLIVAMVLAVLSVVGAFLSSPACQRRGRQAPLRRPRRHRRSAPGRGRAPGQGRRPALHLQPGRPGNANLGRRHAARPGDDADPGTATLRMSTTQGDLDADPGPRHGPLRGGQLRLPGQQEFFDGSPCHREINPPAFGVLQCGDPTGSGSGGPATVRPGDPGRDDLPARHDRDGQQPASRTDGSQFFLFYTDTQLAPDYTPVGTIDEAGLAVLDEIAAAGNDGSFEAGRRRRPEQPVTINTMTVVG